MICRIDTMETLSKYGRDSLISLNIHDFDNFWTIIVEVKEDTRYFYFIIYSRKYYFQKMSFIDLLRLSVAILLWIWRTLSLRLCWPLHPPCISGTVTVSNILTATECQCQYPNYYYRYMVSYFKHSSGIFY